MADDTSRHNSAHPNQQALVAVWQHLREDWEKESAHDSFVQMAAASEQLAFAAKCYRSVAQEESLQQRADAQLQKITGLALAQLAASHSPAPETKRTMTWIAFVVSVLLIISCFLAVRGYL